MKRIACCFLLMLLGACGGGGGRGLTESELDELRSDPRTVRLSGIISAADTLLMSDGHVRYTFTVGGITERDSVTVRNSCRGSLCIGDDGEYTTIADVVDPEVETRLTEATLGTSAGFDTIEAKSELVRANVPDVTFHSFPTANTYGLWGEHGYAQISVADGAVTGESQGYSIQGDTSVAIASALGVVNGTNPTGLGSATWRGIANAASLNTFRLQEGTVTVSIADLSRPRVGVRIDISGRDISEPGWSDMPLNDGRFSHYRSGGSVDRYVTGDFYGPRHEEAYGVFGTAAYVGSFGAKRTP